MPLFLREDQTFVPGGDLRQDLGRLDSYYDDLPASEKQKGVLNFAQVPPDDELVSRLWNKCMVNGWRSLSLNPEQLGKVSGMSVQEYFEQFEQDGQPIATAKSVDSDTLDQLVIKQQVQPKKGKWQRF